MGKKRKVPGINGSSSADIAFMLLLFFLLTTSMDTDMGLARRLPRPPEKQEQDQEIDIKKRNMLVVLISSTNQVLCGDEYMDVKQIRAKAKEFIANVNNDPNLPEKEEIDVPFFGKMMVTKSHIISLKNDRGTQYQAYINVQNELAAAYNELRDEISKQKWNKTFAELNPEQQKAVQTIYPQKISEAEPRNIMGKFNKSGGREMPELNTASLPDLVFAFLFFIMMVTTMREVTLKVQFRAPQATELQKLEKKSLVTFIYVGKPMPEYQAKMGSESRLQLNDAFAEVSEVGSYIGQEKSSMKEEDQPFMTVSIKADYDTKMGLVTDLKQALREAYALKISYSARKKVD